MKNIFSLFLWIYFEVNIVFASLECNFRKPTFNICTLNNNLQSLNNRTRNYIFSSDIIFSGVFNGMKKDLFHYKSCRFNSFNITLITLILEESHKVTFDYEIELYYSFQNNNTNILLESILSQRRIHIFFARSVKAYSNNYIFSLLSDSDCISILTVNKYNLDSIYRFVKEKAISYSNSYSSHLLYQDWKNFIPNIPLCVYELITSLNPIIIANSSKTLFPSNTFVTRIQSPTQSGYYSSNYVNNITKSRITITSYITNIMQLNHTFDTTKHNMSISIKNISTFTIKPFLTTKTSTTKVSKMPHALPMTSKFFLTSTITNTPVFTNSIEGSGLNPFENNVSSYNSSGGYKYSGSNCDNCLHFSICNKESQICDCSHIQCQTTFVNDSVCGTDGISYPSQCHLQLESCHHELFIFKLHKGTCTNIAPCDNNSIPRHSKNQLLTCTNNNNCPKGSFCVKSDLYSVCCVLHG